jgi:hypothetical protein
VFLLESGRIHVPVVLNSSLPFCSVGHCPLALAAAAWEPSPAAGRQRPCLFTWATVGTGPVAWSRHPSGLSWLHLHEHTLAYLQVTPVLTNVPLLNSEPQVWKMQRQRCIMLMKSWSFSLSAPANCSCFPPLKKTDLNFKK